MVRDDGGVPSLGPDGRVTEFLRRRMKRRRAEHIPNPGRRDVVESFPRDRSVRTAPVGCHSARSDIPFGKNSPGFPRTDESGCPLPGPGQPREGAMFTSVRVCRTPGSANPAHSGSNRRDPARTARSTKEDHAVGDPMRIGPSICSFGRIEKRYGRTRTGRLWQTLESKIVRARREKGSGGGALAVACPDDAAISFGSSSRW